MNKFQANNVLVNFHGARIFVFVDGKQAWTKENIDDYGVPATFKIKGKRIVLARNEGTTGWALGDLDKEISKLFQSEMEKFFDDTDDSDVGVDILCSIGRIKGITGIPLTNGQVGALIQEHQDRQLT